MIRNTLKSGKRLPVIEWTGRLWKFKLSEVDEWGRAGGANEEKNEESISSRSKLFTAQGLLCPSSRHGDL